MCHVFRLPLPTPALESGEAMRAGAASDLGPHAQTRAEPSMQQVLRTGKEARRAFTGATAGEKSSESLAGPSQAVAATQLLRGPGFQREIQITG